MNNEKKIIDKIINDANAEVAEIMQKANANAEKRLNEARDIASGKLDKAMDQAKIEADQAKFKEISNAEMISRKRILSTKQNLIEEVLLKTKQNLLSKKDDIEIILTMIKKANVNKSMEVILPFNSKSLQVGIENAGYKVSSENRDFSGGFILKSGDIEYNYSFESILSVEKEELEQLAAKILFN